MRAAIYTRVSQDRAGEAKSVASQEQECRDLCERNGWEISAVYVDNDRSASRYARKTRPEFERLLTDLSQFDVLVTWEASRATRDLEVYVQLRAACRAAKVQWAYSGRVYDFTRTDDSFSTGLDMLVAERESGQTSERVQRVVRQVAQAGKPHGRIPFGYTRTYDQTTGSLVAQVPHPEESKIIIEGAARILAGESAYAIAKSFREEGRPLMGALEWQPNRLARLLKNPTYAGKRIYRGEVIGEATWPALIGPEQWEALQGIMLNPERLKFHGSEARWLLTGIARCGKCGATMNRLNNRGHHSYLCRVSSCVSRRVEDVDAVVVGVVRRVLALPDALERIHAQDAPDVSGALGIVRELEGRLEGFYVQAAEGSLSPAGLARVESSIQGKLDAAREVLRELSRPRGLDIGDPAEVSRTWDTLPLANRRSIIRALMDIEIMPVGRGTRTFDPESVKIVWKGGS